MIHKKVFFYINTIQDLNLEYIKKIKSSLILQDTIKTSLEKYKVFVKECKKRRIKLYISNNTNLLFKLRLNGFYVSAYNKKPYSWPRLSKKKLK